MENNQKTNGLGRKADKITLNRAYSSKEEIHHGSCTAVQCNYSDSKELDNVRIQT